MLEIYREKNVTDVQDVYKHCDYLQSMNTAPENYSVCFSLIKYHGVIFFIFSAGSAKESCDNYCGVRVRCLDGEKYRCKL